MSKDSLDKADNQTEITFTLQSPYDQLRLVARHWPVPGVSKPHAVVLFVHGSGEHCQRYRHVAQFFVKHQIPCVAYDLRGHGLSGGERGFTPHIEALLVDLECVLKHIREELNFKDIPLVIYAHGTGCVTCLAHVLPRSQKKFDCQALIMSTPSVCLKNRPNHVVFFVSRAFANLSPHFRLPVDGNYTNEYANDPEIVAAYRKDLLVHDRWPARTVSLFLEVGLSLERTVLQFQIPVMIQHGAADNITPVEVIRNWVTKRVKAKELTYKEWPGHYHELHNDKERQEVLDHALDWIKKNLKIEQNLSQDVPATTT